MTIDAMQAVDGVAMALKLGLIWIAADSRLGGEGQSVVFFCKVETTPVEIPVRIGERLDRTLQQRFQSLFAIHDFVVKPG